VGFQIIYNKKLMAIKRRFDENLDELRGTLLQMGGLTEEMIVFAVKILVQRDESFVDKVRAHENRVNDLHVEIDDRCLRLIELHQPVARDLRLIATALKINADIERIGDQATSIARTSTHLCRMPRIELGNIPRMVEVARAMVKDSLDAFARQDVKLARSVIACDDEQDRLNRGTFKELLRLMQTDASVIERAMEIILISRNLERIADHASNIAEDVVFLVLGKDIRHHAEDRSSTQALPQQAGR
jgi:phosphate transport system protein